MKKWIAGVMLMGGFFSLVQAQPEVESFLREAALAADAGETRAWEYRLGIGDIIEISVFGAEDFRYSVQIGSTGAITVPRVGLIPAAGTTVPELVLRLEEALRGKLFRDPSVSVEIKEYRAHPIVILGAVSQPGTYQKTDPRMTLIDLVAKAGGLSPGAGEFVFIQRKDPDGGEPEIIKISLNDLFKEGVMSLNVPLQSGDVINIPPREREARRVYYVIGEVMQPGVFQILPEEHILATQAIAAAGGTLRTAKMSKGILVRINEDGAREELKINFKKMLAGKIPDIVVQPRDIIFIPGSQTKTIAYGLLGIIPSSAQSAAGGVIR